jgi:DNA-binding phage protein
MASQTGLSDDDFRKLMDKVQSAKGASDFAKIAGMTRQQLQEFLETKAGIPADEQGGAQSVLAAAVSVAYHC